MPDWFGRDTSWNDLRRIATGINASKIVGAGHDPVSLDDNADNILTVGAGDTPQEIGLVKQDAFTFFAGPNVVGPADYPTFRLAVVADLPAHNLLSATHGDTVANTVARGSLVFGNAGAAWDELTHPGIGYALTTDANDVGWDLTPVWPGLHTFTATPAIEIDVASGDPVIVFDTAGADRFTLGVDDNDSDKFKINSGATLANPSDFELDSSGNVEIGGDFNLLTGKGLIYADSVAAGKVPLANGVRYVPGDVTVSIITDLAYDTPALTLGVANAAGAADTVIRSDATILAFDVVNPVTLAVATAAAPGVATVTARRDHAHAITSSSNPGAAAAILASAADGGLQLLRLGIGADPDVNNRITMVDGGQVGQTGGPLLEFDAGNNYLEITGCNVGIGTSVANLRCVVMEADAATNTLTDVLRLWHTTSDTPTALFGTGMLFTHESTSADRNVARIATLWSDATDASRNALFRINTFPVGAALGYFGIWSGNDISNVAQTAIPGGAGDVTGYLWVRYVVVESAGGTSSDVAELAPGAGAHTIYTDGVDTFTLTVAAGGDVTLVRTAGASTIDVMLVMAWI